MEPSHFADSDAAIELVVNRSGTGEGATGRIGASTEGVADPIGVEFEESRDGLVGTRLGFSKADL